MGQVTSKVFGCNVEHENKHLNVFENVFALSLEVLLHEHILTTAVPKRKHKVPQKSNTMLIDIDCESYAICVSCEVVSENDRPHRRLASAHATHKQHLFDFV